MFASALITFFTSTKVIWARHGHKFPVQIRCRNCGIAVYLQSVYCFYVEVGTAPGLDKGRSDDAFENNRFASLTSVAFQSEFPEVTEFIGSKGRITLEEPGHCPTALTVRIPLLTPVFLLPKMPAMVPQWQGS